MVGKTGRESLKRLIQEFKIDNCPLEVAVGAKEFLQDYCIEQVRLVSAGCATFYVWVSFAVVVVVVSKFFLIISVVHKC